MRGGVVRGRRPLATLRVEDLDLVADWYRSAFDAAVHRDGPDRATVRLTRQVSVLLLGPSEADAAGVPPGREVGVAATVPVARPQRLLRQLGQRSVHVLAPEQFSGRPGTFAVIDPDWNTLAWAARPGPLAAAARLLDLPVVQAAWAALDERRQARVEAPELAAFGEFYRALPDPRNVFYMFFSAGLLHWVAKACSYVPDELNLVLVGTDLPAEEQAWLRRLGRPFHHVPLRIDDQTAWEFLFAVNEHDFGWLDVDCLVLEPGLFTEMVPVPPGDLVSFAWRHESGLGFPVASTYLLGVNAAAVRAVRGLGIGASPRAYRWSRASREIPGRDCWTRIPGRRLRRRLLRLLPPDEHGRPQAPGGGAVFETTVLFQLVARTLGYGAHPARRLAPVGQHRPGRDGDRGDEFSDELVHIGGVSYAGPLTDFSRRFHPPETRLRRLIAEYVALSGTVRTLPPSYRRRLDLVVAEMAALGLPESGVAAAARDFLVRAKGLSERAVDRVLYGPG